MDVRTVPSKLLQSSKYILEGEKKASSDRERERGPRFEIVKYFLEYNILIQAFNDTLVKLVAKLYYIIIVVDDFFLDF